MNKYNYHFERARAPANTHISPSKSELKVLSEHPLPMIPLTAVQYVFIKPVTIRTRVGKCPRCGEQYQARVP